MKFTKMNGTGNDFIIINNIEEKIPSENFSEIAKKLCHREMSIGSDGLMIVDKPTYGGDYKMIFYNSDGSLGEMCGNGARCIARYGYDNKLAGEIQNIETTAGMVIGKKIDKRNYRVKLNNPTLIKQNLEILIDGEKYICSYVELGNPPLPHAVVEFKGLKNTDLNKLRELGRKIRNYEGFPKGANVNFYDLQEDGTVLEKTFERGVEDFTFACGTGTGSLGLILTLQKIKDGNKIRVTVPGGELFIDIEKKGDHIEGIYLTGVTNLVARGDVLDEELNI